MIRATTHAIGPVIAGIFRLADAVEAHKAGETGHIAGKLVSRVVP